MPNVDIAAAALVAGVKLVLKVLEKSGNIVDGMRPGVVEVES